jgi:hypothetical protein
MAAAARLLVQHLEQEQSRTKRAARLAVAVSLGTLAWTFVIGFAIFNFSQRITWVLLKEQTEEILYFAYAFSVASAITAVVAYAAAGRKRWAIGACAMGFSSRGLWPARVGLPISQVEPPAPVEYVVVRCRDDWSRNRLAGWSSRRWSDGSVFQ